MKKIEDFDELKQYLDYCIRAWRNYRVAGEYGDHTCACYIDAYQSVRMSVFGELLPKEDK